MYQSPSQPGQWSQNAPSASQPGQQGQQHSQQPPQQQGPPQAWSPQPPNGQNPYPPPRPSQQSIGPPLSHPPAQGPVMATLQPSHPDQYRALPSLPPPQQMYAQQYPQAQQMGYGPTQPAPRQRTAIACRYCRRRKIRCSGFDQSEDGRCTNCQRFSQECVFTPVSAQTQAFVPAHTVWRGQNPPPNTQLYGAYGQPLPPGGRDAYPQQQQQQQPGQYGPPPQGYQQQPPMYPQQPQQGGPGGPMQTPNPGDAGRKRANDEPHTPTLPPPNPASQMPHRGSGDGQYTYPDQTAEKDNGEKHELFRRNPTKSVGVQVNLLSDAKEQAS